MRRRLWHEQHAREYAPDQNVPEDRLSGNPEGGEGHFGLRAERTRGRC